MPELVTTEQLQEAEAFLRQLHRPDDQWILTDGRQYLKISDVEDKLFGLSSASISSLASSGKLPDAVLISQQAGWRLSRLGLIYYIAQQRRRMLGTRASGQ